ncbi:MAG TPA: hypothetical protein VKV36_07395 [Acidimicrobiales bacterium]|nr:hypothetical protein [Acidimicrobiales bacterium]
MRRWRGKRAVALVVAAGLGLAACGVKATIDQAVSSLGASPYLQVHLTASASGPGTAQAQQVLSALSLDMQYASTSGGALSDAAGKVDARFVVDVHGQPLADVRLVDANLYVLVDVGTVDQIPGVHVSQQDLAAAQLLLGGRWFELPESLLQELANRAQQQAPPGRSTAVQAALTEIVHDVTGVIEATPYTAMPGGGYKETGSLQSVVDAALPGLDQLTGQQLHPGKVQGSYTMALTMSGATATGASLAISVQEGGGTGSLSLDAAFAHDPVAVTTPAGATVITPALLHQLEQLGSGAVTTG